MKVLFTGSYKDVKICHRDLSYPVEITCIEKKIQNNTDFSHEPKNIFYGQYYEFFIETFGFNQSIMEKSNRINLTAGIIGKVFLNVNLKEN
jgi:hypothetical protein